ncbi:ATP-binding cassette domain-containing protein [Sneathiella sp. CAU 1612]|uniref:ATP-binding cassette domain-containing protein n=1 Tax=Sneathiella sedimenti TaxID=2816034 RepID=A0ABS3F297_9PROT|nr:oligopeptide/dipeptide ABC transporter ATP-binding protein [Sneathiella sedimenti]MBO0332623.1 ATP-binding cassette domain-containing protein [Sneathiella sedimenti]
MNALLSVKNLQKVYPTKVGMIKAVDDVSFDVAAGETVALVGESGCGKSSIALSLLQLISSDGGTVHFDGTDFTSLSDQQRQQFRKKLSIVFQNPFSSLNPKMRVRDIVGEPLKTVFGLKGSKLEERVAQHLRDVGLGREHLKRYPHEFSGGQRQRIAIARALALEPRMLILDEPTAALDVSVQAQVLNLLKELQAKHGLSFLFISHNLATVNYIADRVMVMYLGRIVESGPVHSIFSSPAHPYTQALLASIPSLDPLKKNQLVALSGEVPSPLSLPAGCAFANRCPYASDLCRTLRPDLLSKSEAWAVACHHPIQGEED